MRVVVPVKHASALLLLAFLAACGGGSTTGSGTSPVSGGPTQTPAPGSFANLSNSASVLLDAYVTDAGTAINGVSRSTTVPTSGTAVYNGYFYGTAGGTDIIAALELDANFAGRAITGTADSFAASTGVGVSGALSGAGAIEANAGDPQPQATLVLRGTLTIGGAAAESAIALDGDFYAKSTTANAAIVGIAEGNIGADVLENGIFGAEN